MTDEVIEAPATETVIPEGAGTPAPAKLYPIYVVYQAGKKTFGRDIQTPFEDIDRVDHVIQVAQYLSQKHDDKDIVILNWKALDG